MLFNLSVFKDLRELLTFGVETDVASELDGDSHVLFLPQVHYEINDRFEIQGGIGAEFASQESNLTAAFRFIYSR